MTYLRAYLVLCGDRDLLRFSLLPSEPCWLWRLNEGEWEWLPRTAFWFLFLEASVELDVDLMYLPASLKRTMMRKVNRWVGKSAGCWFIIDFHLRTLFITEHVNDHWVTHESENYTFKTSLKVHFKQVVVINIKCKKNNTYLASSVTWPFQFGYLWNEQFKNGRENFRSDKLLWIWWAKSPVFRDPTMSTSTFLKKKLLNYNLSLL